jgi:hypothetical protein
MDGQQQLAVERRDQMLGGIVLGFAASDPNSKIYCAFSPATAGLRSDQRAPSSAPFKDNAVLEYGPTEILPPIGANWKTLRVSATRSPSQPR